MAERTDPRSTEITERGDGEPALPPGPGPAVARPAGDVAARAVRARGNGRPASPDDMRREIEATRERMSRTLDELETRLVTEKEALVRKREALWAKATLQGFRRGISREPWRSMAIAFAAGYIIAAIRD